MFQPPVEQAEGGVKIVHQLKGVKIVHQKGLKRLGKNYKVKLKYII